MTPIGPDPQHGAPTAVAVGLNAVIVAVTDDTPRVLTVRRAEHDLAERAPARTPGAGSALGGRARALPFGPLQLEVDRTLQQGLRRWVRGLTGLELGYVEQLYTFGDADREPDRPLPVLSVAYLALVRQAPTSGSGEAEWLDWYALLPWEDWREGRPTVLDREIAPALERWCAHGDGSERARRRERSAIAFGLGSPWDAVRVLERYELLYEAALLPESVRDRAQRAGHPAPSLRAGPAWQGVPLALDHRRIAATALSRVRGKLTYRPVVFELLAPAFTLSQLQRVVEALSGVRVHTQNFRRLVERGGLVEPTGEQAGTGGRPAALFRFRRQVLRERPAPGVGLPGMRAV